MSANLIVQFKKIKTSFSKQKKGERKRNHTRYEKNPAGGWRGHGVVHYCRSNRRTGRVQNSRTPGFCRADKYSATAGL